MELLRPLRFCTHISCLKLEMEASIAALFWNELFAILHTTLSSISSTEIQSLSLAVDVSSQARGEHEYIRFLNSLPSPDSDAEFLNIDTGPLHDIIGKHGFPKLSRIEIMVRWHTDLPLKSDTVLSAEDMAHRIASMLRPLERRGILSILCNSPPKKEWNYFKAPHWQEHVPELRQNSDKGSCGTPGVDEARKEQAMEVGIPGDTS